VADDETATRIILVRHGETDWNAAGMFQGHGGKGLSQRGRAQARATATLLARDHADAALIARSDLQRVAETSAPAEAVLAASVLVEERLREIDVGLWTGKTRQEIAAADPDGWAAWQRGEDLARGGGETFAQLRERVWLVLGELAEKAGHATALVFTHGGPIRVAVAAALDLPLGGERRLAPVANCSLTELARTAAGDWRLVTYNGFEHLSASAGT
jgi:broad specificity phosphatase PhoE